MSHRMTIYCIYSLLLSVYSLASLAAPASDPRPFQWQALQYQPLHSQDAANYSLTTSAAQAHFDTGRSTYLAFALPTDVSTLSLQIKSLLQDSVFYPDIMLLNAQFQPIQHLRSPDVHYTAAKLLSKAGITAQLNLDLSQPIAHRPAYLVLFTTATQLSQYTEVANAYDAYAAARGNVSTGSKPRRIPHSLYGEIRIQRQSQPIATQPILQVPNLSLATRAPQTPLTTTPQTQSVPQALIDLYRAQVQQQLAQGDLASAHRSIQALQQLLDQLREQVNSAQQAP